MGLDFFLQYKTYENLQSPSEEAQKNFQLIKKISREYETVTRQLDRHWPILPLDQVTNFDEEFKQLQAWKRYILWEKQNPLKLESPEAIVDRGETKKTRILLNLVKYFLYHLVMYAYDQCLSCMSYHFDIWLEAANYLINLSKTEGIKESDLQKIIETQVAKIYEKALNSFMANNTLIYLAYANFEEVTYSELLIYLWSRF